MSSILKGLNESYFNRDEQDQQNAMDTRRRSDLSGERNAGLNEPDELPTTPQQSRNGVYEYNVPTGQEKIAQELGLQLHKGHWVSRVPVQKADFQFGRPQFHEILAKNVSEAEQDYGPEYQEKVKRLGQMAKQGERKTVWDPVKRVYKTVPVNPPKEQGVAEGSKKSITPEQMIRDAVEAYKQEAAKENPNTYILDSIKSNINDIKREIERKKQGVAESVDYKSDAEALKKQGNMIGYHKTMVRYYDALANNASHRADVKRYEALANKHHAASKGVAEGLSKRDQQDVAAIRAAIARLEAQLNHPNADRDAIQQSIAHEKKRLALYGQDVAEGKDDKIAQLKKDHDTAVHWSKNETSPQKREAARQKAEKIKRHLETQYKQGVAEAELDEAKTKRTVEDIFIKGKKVGSITTTTTQSGMIFYTAQVGNSFVAGPDTREEALKHLKRLYRDSQKEQGVAEGSKTPTDWMGVPTKLAKNDKKPIKRPSGYDEYIKQGAKQGFQDDPTNPLRKKVKEQGVAEGSDDKEPFNYDEWKKSTVKPRKPRGYKDAEALGKAIDSEQSELRKRKEQGVAEGFPKDPNAPKLVQDRKTGKWYDPNKEFEKKMNSPEVMAQMKRMAQKEGVAEGVAETLPMDDAVKVLRQYGADHFKTTSNELHFYKQGRPFSVDLVMNPDATRNVTLSSLNSATRGLKGQGVAEEQEESCPHCGGAMFSEMIMNEKKDACYYKVKSRYKVWPSAYASGALVKCRKSGADSWGDGGKKNESSILEGIEQVDENLNKWFKEKWVRFGPDGKIRGDCARGDDSEGKPKCLPQSKAQNLGKEGRASAAARKRREDPNPERSGKAINVNTKKKSNEGVAEGSSTNAEVTKRAKAAAQKAGKTFNTDGEYRLWYAITTQANAATRKADKKQGVAEAQLDEKWSQKYKDSINCSNPKGFSQRAHCQGKNK
jgi:hypothetical protein